MTQNEVFQPGSRKHGKEKRNQNERLWEERRDRRLFIHWPV